MTTVAVAGAVANKPGNGGEAWVRMSWVRGLERLGLDVWFVEELSPEAWGESAAACVDWFGVVRDRFDLGERAVLVDATDGRMLEGGPFPDCELLVDISGHLRRPELLARCRRRAYVDIDPVYTQVWHTQGGDLGLDDHDVHFTVGLNIGTGRCGVPSAGFQWLPVLPPVVLDDWPDQPASGGGRFTTIAAWRGGFGRLEHDGVTFGQKAHEFRRFAALPTLVDAVMEMALDIDPADEADRLLLETNGWQLVNPAAATGHPDRFRSYVARSPAEFSVAQGAYVATASGWFSDRTARYLASGRPAIVQDTGIAPCLPVGEGLLTYATIGEAVNAVGRVETAYEQHAAAARAFAERHLDAAVVLPRFLDQAGLG